jgi:hypothetical protein
MAKFGPAAVAAAISVSVVPWVISVRAQGARAVGPGAPGNRPAGAAGMSAQAPSPPPPARATWPPTNESSYTLQPSETTLNVPTIRLPSGFRLVVPSRSIKYATWTVDTLEFEDGAVIELSAPSGQSPSPTHPPTPRQPPWGQRGENGGQGAEGEPGLDAASLVIYVKKRIHGKGTLWIHTNGGPGGRGGDGGDGATGGGSSCTPREGGPTPGGRGGDGGPAANGRDGGATGEVRIRGPRVARGNVQIPAIKGCALPCSQPTLDDLAHVKTPRILVWGSPGCPGQGGTPGRGGDGGGPDRECTVLGVVVSRVGTGPRGTDAPFSKPGVEGKCVPFEGFQEQ